MDVPQPQEHVHADAGVGVANVAQDRRCVDISPDISDHFHMAERSAGVQALYGGDVFQPYGSPVRVRMLNFRVEYRQKEVPLVLQDVNCVGECPVVVCRLYTVSPKKRSHFYLFFNNSVKC